MAELATIARPYAEALFEACRDDLPATGDWLAALAEVAADPQLLQLVVNPQVSAEQVQDLIAGALGAALPQRGMNFLRMLVDNKRLAALPEVERQFRALVGRALDVTEAVVHTPFVLSEAELVDLQPALEKRFGCKLTLTQVPDASLIGGIKVVAGDEVLDTSVKARLDQMKVALTA